MARIVFPQSTAPADWPHESSGRLVNAQAEPLQPGAPSDYVVKRAPGLRSFVDTGQSGYRGGIYVEPYFYAALAGQMVKATVDGTVSGVDALVGSGPAFFARNNKVPVPDRLVVTENGVFVFTESGVTDLGDADLPQPNAICAHDGYLIFTIADGRAFSSELNGTGINSADFIKAESNPDGLLRPIPYGRDILLCGQDTIEVFWNAGNPTGFPYSRVTTIPVGLIGQKAIAGWEPEFGTRIVFVASDFTVRLLRGYDPVVISPPHLNRLIERVSDKSTVEVSVFVAGGNAYAKVSGPGFAWVYDLTFKWWHERASYLSTDWRFTGQTVKAFGKWLGGDSLSGKILEVADGYYREDTAPLRYSVESIAMEGFPSRIQVPRVDFNFVTGTGVANGEDPIERSPQVEISWSDDGGFNWATPLLRSLGAQQIAKFHPYVMRTGLSTAKGRRWRVEVADPVYAGLLGADMAAEARAA